jgi:RNA polymerase sigma factor (sigma-70 family)
MATHRLRLVVRQLHATVEAQSDAQLLTEFVTARDEAAFAALVRRHGPMVLGVCRRILDHTQDAEDVFQATFLVLARKAYAVMRRETVGTWLYRVAYRTAQEARSMRTRRRAKERQVANLLPQHAAAVEVQDWRPILDEELDGLPEKYRAPLVLCELESRPRKEAAEQLRIPEGTLSSRLAKARKMLGLRLARRGVTLSSGAVVAALGQDALSASVSGPLVVETARVATLAQTGELASVSGPVALLMKGALKTMFMAKFKVVGVMLLVACLTLGAGSVAYHPVEAQNPTPAGKPLNELEALRRENALLKLNLEVVLEKVRAQAAELEKHKQKATTVLQQSLYRNQLDRAGREWLLRQQLDKSAPAPAPDVEALLRNLREANTNDARDKAIDALEKTVRQLREDANVTKRSTFNESPKKP